MNEPAASVRAVLARAVPYLASAGVPEPRLDAELLMAHVLGRTRLWLSAHPESAVDPAHLQSFHELLERRRAREPLPYLLGYREFLGLRFEVTRDVLIPRPETETLVEAAAGRLPPGARILEVGAGSGCVAVGLARFVPGARVDAVEACSRAAEVARRNAAALAPGSVRVHHARFPDDCQGWGPYDALVSNPPYVAESGLSRAEPEVRDWEPRLATSGGEDGLLVLRELVDNGPSLVQAGGLFAVEVAEGQAGTVVELLRQSGAWEGIETVPDLAGIPRVVLAVRTNLPETGGGGESRTV